MKIAVVIDSGSGLTKIEAQEQGLFYLPLQIIDGETVYLDGDNVSKAEIFQLMKEGKMLKTSMPPLGMIEALFKKLIADGFEHVISIPLTSGISSTSQTVDMCAKGLGLAITTIECYSACNIQQYLAQSAKRLIDEGLELDDIVSKLKDAITHSNSLIIPDDLNHLKRGGRLTPLAAALAGMLKIKPILQINQSTDGKIDTFAKVRTMSKAMKESVDAFVKEGIKDDYILILFHANAEQLLEEYKTLYFDKFPNNETIIDILGPVISVHTGVGCVGIQYIKKI